MEESELRSYIESIHNVHGMSGVAVNRIIKVAIHFAEEYTEKVNDKILKEILLQSMPNKKSNDHINVKIISNEDMRLIADNIINEYRERLIKNK